MTLYMVWKDSNGKYDVVYFKTCTKETAYLGGQDSWWTRSEYRNRTVEVKSRQDLQRIYDTICSLEK